MITRILEVIVLPEGDDIFSERAYRVAIDDEAAGEFVRVKEVRTQAEIVIDPSEWPDLRRAINRMVGACRPDDNSAEAA